MPSRPPLRAGTAAPFLLAVAVVAWAVLAPLFAARYPPITDLPFHAAATSTFRHWLDPDWHFREQFTLAPLAVPYVSMYALGAMLALVLPITAAVKLAAAVMLALLPAGLATMFWGMKKSPLLGLAALPLCWCNLTHWGFFNFVGALGLFAMTIGLTLRALDRPSRGRTLALLAVLVALFFTHIFRFPFALCAIAGTAAVMYPATRRLRPVLLPLLVGVALMLLWMRVRTEALDASFGPFTLHGERLDELRGLLFGGLTGPAEARAVGIALRVLVAVGGVSLALRILAWGRAEGTARARRWALGVLLVPLACALVFLGLFLWLPMQMGAWWYVYPREAVAAAFLAIGLLPDLPRAALLRVPMAAALAFGGLCVAQVVRDDYARFAPQAEELAPLIAELPQAPKLLYLVQDHSGSTRSTTPYIHLPAWAQAEKGGWLSFHFAMWKATPVLYRDRSEPGALLAPEVPLRWEWTPEIFRVGQHGAFFDWFLVRRRTAPDALFRTDPTIERVGHSGTWWLYRRNSVDALRR